MNPITEMKANVTTIKAVKADFEHALRQKKKAIRDFYDKKEQVEQKTQTDAAVETQSQPTASTPSPPKILNETQQKIIQWAKQHYQSYHDIKRCADELKVRPGMVYVTLKFHNFIKSVDSTEYRVMMAYFKYNGSLRDICEETGLTVWIVAKTVERLGYSPRWHEYRESRYITKNSHGVGAEDLFRRLVTQAVDMNEDFVENHPDYDFVVNDKTVDVKEVTYIKRKEGRKYFEIRVGGEIQPDYYCVFLCHNKELRTKGDYDILLIPTEVIPKGKRTISFGVEEDSKSREFWYEFKVEPIALAHMLGAEC